MFAAINPLYREIKSWKLNYIEAALNNDKFGPLTSFAFLVRHKEHNISYSSPSSIAEKTNIYYLSTLIIRYYVALSDYTYL